MQRKVIVGLLYLFCGLGLCQNKPILYDFADIPQAQLLNPALDFEHKKHIGVPFLSGLHAELGMKNFSLFDFFGAASTPFSEKLVNITNKLSRTDFLSLNGQIDIINVGFRLKNNNYLSVGFYQETDLILFHPKDPVAIILSGNRINQLYNISDVALQLDVLGVFHAGLSKKVSDNVTLGLRFKVYSSFIQAQSSNNTGTFITVEGTNNLLLHRFNNFNAQLQTAGIFFDNNSENDSFTKNFANNLGLGIDLGIVNQLSPQLKLSASIVDLGFINNLKKVKTYTLQGDYIFEGFEADFLSNNATPPEEETRDESLGELLAEENSESYISLRPLKAYAALKYSFGKYQSRLCYDNSYKKEYANAVGVQFFSVIRARGPQMALTGFYERMLTKNFKTKITYTLDSFTFSNIGIGASTKIGKVNFYGTIGNLIQMANFSKSNHFTAQMGINIIIHQP